MRWLRQLTGQPVARPALPRALRPPAFEWLEERALLSGSLLITEFMADNKSTLADENGDFSDWIELQNTSSAPIDLAGWKLRDSGATWTFPAKTLAPGQFLIVFASDKNRTNPTLPLHTNFKLGSDGDSLTLVRPDGAIEQAFDPYPAQFEDISYGLSQTSQAVLGAGAPLGYKVPSAADAGLGTTWTQTGFNDAAFATTMGKQVSRVLITEAATGTNELIEVQNVSPVAVNTTGWFLAASNSNTDINVVNDVFKPLPATLTASEVTYFGDAASDPAWGGSGITWTTNGSGWVMLVNNAGEVEDFLVWGFSAAAIATLNVTVNGVAVSAADLPWTGNALTPAGTSSNSIKRTGSSDSNTAANFAYTSGQTKGTANANLITPFGPSIVTATTGIGYSVNGAGAGFEVKVYKGNVAIENLAAAEAVVSTPALQASVSTGRFDVVNFLGTGAVGNYANDAVYPGSTAGQDVDDYVSVSTTRIYIPRPGKWTFGVSSDDGFRLDVSGHGESLRTEFDGVRGATDTLGVFDAPVAGIYDVRVLQFDHGGGSSVELFAAEGQHAAFNASFDLVGDVVSGGLAAGGFTADIQTNVQPQMRSVNSSIYTRIDFNVANPAVFDALTLNMKYDAGFVAYLNGEKIAERNAPASPLWNSAATAERLTSDAAFFEAIDITPFLILLQPGVNVLAIHGLNSSAADGDFILLPEIVGTSTGDAQGYFFGPTPGATNGAGVSAFVEELTFSADHGFYGAAFQLTLATATSGATIRYTTNGSTPSATNGTVYSGPITINKTTILRAIAFKTGFTSSAVQTQSYFFVADIVNQSSATATALGFPGANVNGQVIDYGMDPDIVSSPTWGPQLAAALTDIPSMSVVTDIANLFDASTGIYVNAGQDGALWERPISLELIDPSGAEEGFQIDAGIRIRGGFSRSTDNPKHSLRFFFRSEYGEAKLDYPLFGDEGVDEFDKFDLRTSQNYSWAFGGDGRNIMNRDVFFRDLQRDMEEQYTRSRYYHLYINGQYWGLYQSQERSEAAFAADYLGGEPEDYDVVKVEAGPYTINATDGNLDAWAALWNLANQGFETDAKYYAVQGRNASGIRNPALPVYIDQDNLIDYMINILYGGNLDAPISNFLGNGSPNNWYGVYNHTTKDQGFQFFAHDSEHTILTDNLGTNRNGPFPAGDTFDKSNPQWIHQKLMAHPEYRLRFADRVQELFFNDGALTVANNVERFLARAAEIELAIIAESARWGDAKVASPFTKDNWQAEINNLVGAYFPQRGNILLSQLRSTTLVGGAPAPLFPSIDAPAFNVHGGAVGDNFNLLITALGGLVYYTLDGTDPRLPGGGISPSAIAYDPATTSTALIAAGATWKYLDNGSNQGTAWRNVGFNDGAWASGPAQLGYGDGDEATTVSFGPNASSKYITTYFRKTFNVADLGQVTGLTLRLLRDDGAAIYINGQEVTAARSNLPGAFDFSTPAAPGVGGADESTFLNIPISPSLLVAGVNTIAVEIHQSAGDSTDISFDLELLATRSNAPPIPLSETGPVLARARSASNEWSALSEATFQLNTPPSAGNFAVTEVNYHPQGPTAAELLINSAFVEDDFEFIELQNTGTDTIDLFGVRFAAGIAFDFSDSSIQTLAPGQRVLVVSNLAGFQARYGTGKPVAGEYTGQLTNSGEQVLLVDGGDLTLADITYADSGAWPSRPDGGGSSLETVSNTGDYNNPGRWRASSEVGGSPGIAGLGPDNRIVVNEVLAHTDPPLKDSIELLNRTGAAINIGGWYITDDTDNLTKFRIPNGTSIAANGYRVYDDDDFNPGLGTLPNDFSFNAAHGDSAYLIQADATGKPIRFVDAVSFGAQANAESWGRFPNGTGELTPMLARSLGSANGNPRVGPVVISELMYNPPVPAGGLPVGVTVDHLEFIEIYNPTSTAIDLAEWRLRGGVEFDFPTTPGTLILAPGAALIIASFDPASPANATRLATFRSVYGLAASVPIVGGYSGLLDDGGESIRLERPDEPPDDEPLFFPHLLEDRVVYDDAAPWPVTPDGGGQALRRADAGLTTYGGLPASWLASAPTPGVHTIVTNNDPPVAQNNSYNATEDVALVISAALGVLTNDSDPNGDPLSASILTGPSHGSLTLNSNGSFTYTPTANYNGPDGFTYTAADGRGGFDTAAVTLTIAPVNDAPVAGDDSYIAGEDTPLIIPAGQGVLINDGDVDGDAVSVVQVLAQPLHGTVTLNANGSFTYTAAANYNGPDSFTYRITDGKTPAGLDTGLVNLTVTAINDPPVAQDNSYNATEDAPLVVSAALGVLTNDTDADGDTLIASILSAPAHGSLTLNGNGSFTYTPAANYSGPDAFTYRASDGKGGVDDASVTLTIAPGNDAPQPAPDSYITDEDVPLVVAAGQGLLANDTDPDGDPLTATQIVTQPLHGTVTLNANGSFTYTPSANYNGPDSFTYRASDGRAPALTGTATVSLTINPVADAPVALNDSYSTNEDELLVVNLDKSLLDNDSDPDGDPLTATQIVTQPAHGVVTLNPDGTFSYQPTANYTGADSFVYRAADATGAFDDATVSLTILPINDAPAPVNDAYIFTGPVFNVGAAQGVLANDIDPDGDTLTVVLTQAPTKGGVVLNANGSFTYTPGPNFVLIDTFFYQVRDGKGGIATASATVQSFSTTAPVLAALGNGVLIAGGDVTPTATDHTAFGSANPAGAGTGTITRTFTLRNDGNAILNLTGPDAVTLDGTNAGDFAVTRQPGDNTLSPGESTTFDVTFDPSALGSRAATVHIASDNFGGADYTFAVEGTGAEATGPSVLSVIALDAAGAEAGAGQAANTATFRIIRAGSTASAVTAKFTRKGTAKFGPTGDYTLSVNGVNLTATSVVIPAGQDHIDITVNIVDNALAEPSETVILTLAAGTGYTLTPTTPARTATAAIADNEPLVTVAAIDSAAAEAASDQPANTALIRITRSTAAGTASPLTVKFTLKGVAGFGAGKDYLISVNGVNLSSITAGVVIPAGQDHVDLLIKPIDNALVEAAEALSLTLSTGTAYNLDPVVANRTASVTIADNEPLVTIAMPDSAAAEHAADESVNSATYRISRTGSTASPLTVSFKRSGTATFGPKGDYTLSAGGANLTATKIIIPAGEDHIDITLSAVDNALAEAGETAIITLGTSTAYNLDPVVANRAAAATIADNEPLLTIAATDAAASEPGAGENHGRFTITRTGSTALPLTVKLTKTGTTAAADIIALPTTIVIPAGESTVTLDVIALADKLTEPAETVILTLAASTAYNLPPLAADKKATVTVASSPNQLPAGSIDLALLAATYPALSISLANLAASANKTITTSLRNQGLASSGVFTLEYFLSADRELDEAEDFLLFTATNQAAIPAGATQSRAVKLTTILSGASPLPTPGSYFLIIRVVPAQPDAIAGNNVWASAVNNVVVKA